MFRICCNFGCTRNCANLISGPLSGKSQRNLGHRSWMWESRWRYILRSSLFLKGLIRICGCLPPSKPRLDTRARARNRPSIAHADPNLGQMGCNSMQGSKCTNPSLPLPPTFRGITASQSMYVIIGNIIINTIGRSIFTQNKCNFWQVMT